MTREEISSILSEIQYKDWEFFVGPVNGLSPYYLQVRFKAINTDNGQMEWQRGRKWLLSMFMTKSEIVSTAFLAVLKAEEHETRENFRYKNARIYGPHISVDALAVTCQAIDVRDEVGVVPAGKDSLQR